MSTTLHRNLLRREIDDPLHSVRVNSLYGDQGWVRHLDIVEELEGHTGCVNALTWSKNGKFLASGSDDHDINIFSYEPTDSNKPFSLSTTIHTGHKRNIFSVKFMPHSNDNVLVSCAGDDVRVYDLEYSTSRKNYADVGSKRRKAYHGSQNNCYTFGEVNGKSFKAHSASVERIVTEASPFLFLTCSDDGEVRQFDTRLPASSYPAGARTVFGYPADVEYTGPKPLISYKGFGIGINTISCSPYQPHYIVLAGGHPHCFLHDRRMTGKEPAFKSPHASGGLYRETEMMDVATRCVRRFSPPQYSAAADHLYAHVTGCKISDARPNEMIASWSFDYIYAFDLIKDQHATSIHQRPVHANLQKSQFRHFYKGEIKADKSSRGPDLDPRAQDVTDKIGQVRALLIDCHRIEKAAIEEGDISLGKLLTAMSPTLRTVLESAVSASRIMDEVFTSNPYSELHNAASRHPGKLTRVLRDRARYFLHHVRVWASTLLNLVVPAGSLDRLYDASVDEQFHISLREVHEDNAALDRDEAFVGVMIVKITNWLKGLDHQEASAARLGQILPQPTSSGLVPELNKSFLASLASGNRVYDFDAPAFLKRDDRVVCESEALLVEEFFDVIDTMNWENAAKLEASATDHNFVRRFLLKIARNLLLRYHDQANLSLIKYGLGGICTSGEEDKDMALQERYGSLGGIDSDEDNFTENLDDSDDDDDSERDVNDDDASEVVNDEEPINRVVEGDREEAEDDEPNESDWEDEDDFAEDEDGDDEMYITDDDEEFLMQLEDATSGFAEGQMYAMLGGLPPRVERQKQRNELEKYRADARVQWPMQGPFSGACNVETVKGCAYFGLDNEYVVAGSDTGHVFIWDRKTSRLLNVLKGDHEVVNVVEGHPGEPMMAVSGIDETIKIFSPDCRAQQKVSFVQRRNVGRYSGRSMACSFPQAGYEEIARPFGDEWRIPGCPCRHNVPYGVRLHGLMSRKAFHDVYSILARNDAKRKSALDGALM